MIPAQPPTTAETSPTRRLPLWLIILGTGLTAGLLAAIGGEVTYPALTRRPTIPPVSTACAVPNERCHVRSFGSNTKKKLGTNQAAVRMGYLVVALGVVLGLAGGLQQVPGAVQPGAAAVGDALGGVAGAGLSMVDVPAFFQTPIP